MKRMQLRGCSVVITGASSGIGRALAVRMAGSGARVTLAARRSEELETAAGECRRAGGEAIAVTTDITQPDQCGALIARAAEAHGGIDVLVNNAGVGMRARFDEVTELSIFERLMKVNYLGAVYCTHHALSHLVERGGLICAVSSLAGKTGVPTRSGYAASKHAMQGFFDSLRVELRDRGVDVLVVSPGFVATDIRERILGPEGDALGAGRRDDNRRTISVDDCVRHMVTAIERRQRELVLPPSARAGMALKLVAPGLVDRISARAIDD